MKLKINLISKRRKSSKSRGLVFKLMMVAFGLICLAFLAVTAFVVFRMYSLNKQIDKISAEAVDLSSRIRTNNEAVNNFVLAKGILDYIYEVDKEKFTYKKYLDEIVLILPANVLLRNVDFQVKGWVSAVVSIPTMADLSNFESRITDPSIIEQTVFNSIWSESVTRESSGSYLVKLQFELKKNG